MARPRMDSEREEARLLYLAGESTTDIAVALDVSDRAVRKWATDGEWATARASSRKLVHQLEAQLATLSQGAPTTSRTRRIASLTRSLERLRKAQPDLKLVRPDVAPDLPSPPAPSINPVAEALMGRVLAPEYGLYPYQADFLRDPSRFRCVLKSRQIGFSYVLGLTCLIRAVGGTNQLVASASQEQSNLVLEYVALHAQRLGVELTSRSDTEIQVGGSLIKALPVNQYTTQGFHGDVIFDEFAWNTRARRIWSAVVPSITAVGGRVTVCSTPFVPGNLFWEIAENHKGRWGQFTRTRITIHDAVAQGMAVPGGIEELQGLFDSESWAMMYECHYAEDGTALLSWDLLSRIATTSVSAHLPAGPVWVGVDVGRVNDRTAIAIVEQDKERFRLARLDEHKGRSFGAQRSIILELVEALQVRALRIDRTGLGMQLAEELCQALPTIAIGRYFTSEWKERAALNLLRMCEQGLLTVPNDPTLLSQLHSVKKRATDRGIRYDAERTSDGHADAFWALALACEDLGPGFGGDVEVEVW